MIAKQDRIKPRTPEDLERMYQFEKMSRFATKEEVANIKATIPDVSGLLTQEQAQELIDKAIKEALEKINVENGSAVYNTSIFEERRSFYAIDVRYLANFGRMTLEGLELVAIMSENGACFPLIVDAKRIIKEIIIRTAHGSTLNIRPSGFHSNVEKGTWVFAQDEEYDRTTAEIYSDSATDTIVQLLIITE